MFNSNSKCQVKVRDLVKDHISLLKRELKNLPSTKSFSLSSSYEYPVYTSIFIEDICLFQKWLKPNEKILDFGCGRGTSTYVLSNLGYSLIGLDIDYKEMDPNRASYSFSRTIQEPLWNTTKDTASGGLEFNFYDGTIIPFEDDYFDSVFAYAVLEHVDNLDVTLSEISRVLKKGGTLFISRTPNKFSWIEWLGNLFKVPAHEIKFSKREITDIIQKYGFIISEFTMLDFFPSNIPGNKKLNSLYQKVSLPLGVLEKIIRYTPLNLITHHFRIIAQLNHKNSV